MGTEQSRQGGSWSSYDEAAAIFDAISVPSYFTQPAGRLVEMLRVSASDRLLDVGAGTGIVAATALETIPFVVAVDLSCPMLLRAKARNLRNCVAATAMQLPFTDGSFTRLTASFVLNHVADLNLAVREFARVLADGGCAGITSWASGPSESEAARAWSAVAGEFVDLAALAAEEERALPGERRLANLQTVGEVFSTGGFLVQQLEQREFGIEIATEDYLKSRSSGMAGRYIKHVLEAASWNRFLSQASEHVLRTFGPNLEFSVQVNFAVGQK